jgi:hypothetical protein
LYPPGTGTLPPRLLIDVFKRLRDRSQAPDQVREAFGRFRECAELVEEAKASLAAAAPGGRGAGVPIAQALAEFESGLVKAGPAMSSWRAGEVEDVWRDCSEALREASRRAEALRLGEPPEAYEQLYGVLGDLMEPLEAFGAALARFRDLGAR